MSYSNCPNAVINIGKGSFATGAITWFGTNIPAGTIWNYSVLNGIVTLEVIVPVTATTVNNAVAIANPLPVGLRPATDKANISGLAIANTSTVGSAPILANIATNGVIGFTSVANQANAQNVSVSGLLQYSLL